MRVHLASFALIVPFFVALPAGAAPVGALPPGSEPVRAQVERPALEMPVAVEEPFQEEQRLYREGTRSEVFQALRKLAAAGEAGVTVAAKLVSEQTDSELRDKHQGSLRSQVQRGLATRLAEHDLEGAQALLEALAAGRDLAARRELATFLALTGRGKATQADPLLEAWRLRAAGEPLAARGLLARPLPPGAETTSLRIALAFDLEDWSELATVAFERAGEGGERRLADLGLAAAAFRAAGELERAEKAAILLSAEIAERADEPVDAAIALLLNDRDEEAMPLLMATDAPDTAFNMLSAEWRYREAFELAERVRANDETGAAARAKLEARVARLFKALADPAGALGAVEAHATWSAEDRSPANAAAATIGLEMRLGLEEEARKRAALAMVELTEKEHPRALLGALFPQARTESEVVWAHVSELHVDESVLQRLARCAELLEIGSADPEELSALFAIERERAAEFERADRSRWYRGLASLAERHGRDGLALELAKEWIEAGPQYGAKAGLAERLAQAGQWAEAAELWQEAFLANPSDPSPLALAGWALTEAGWLGVGEELKLQASLIALGDGSRRYRLASLYERKGLFEDAERERKLLLRTRSPSSWAHGATLRSLAGRASCAAVSADAAHWSLQAQLQTFLDRGRMSPGLAGHWARSTRQALVTHAAEEGDARSALTLSGGALAPWLRDLNLTADALDRLSEEGFDVEAEQLAWRLLDRLRQVSDDFPASAGHAHAHAKLAARTGLDLDAAPRTSQRAVELRPQVCWYRSTQAEVSFARGETDEAGDMVRKALERCPKGEACSAFERLHDQLARFAGDSSMAETTAR